MTSLMSPRDSFEAAIKAAGSQSAFARMVGCTPSNISQLIHKGSVLPERYVLKAEAGTGIPKEDFRPDIYPRHIAPAAPTADGSRFEHAR